MLGLTPAAIHHRRQSGQWVDLLPRVYLAHPGTPSRRQRLIAAQLYGGPDCAIDSDDACVFHGVKAVAPDDRLVRVVVPQQSTVRSTGFAVVRRQSASVTTVSTARLRYVEPATAVIVAARRRNYRGALALISDAVQRRVTSPDELLRAHVRGPPRNAAPTDAALAHVRAGVRSAPEADFRLLAEASTVLPRLAYNCVLRLPEGRRVSPDAIALDAGVVHETNGRVAHHRDDLLDDLEARHDLMTTAGLVVLHNSPGRIASQGRQVIAQFERCYLRHARRGLPPDVELVSVAAR